MPHVGGAARLFIVRLPIASLSHACVHSALVHSAPERGEATFCSAGRTGRIGLLVMGRLRSLGCFLLISISVFFSRSWHAISMCRVTLCTGRGERQRDYATPTVDSQRRGATQGREACMRRSERAVRTPWRQERRQRYAQERRHLSSFKCHEAPLGPDRHQGSHLRGCARPSVWSEHSWGLHRPQKGPGTHRNPSLFFRRSPWGAMTRDAITFLFDA